MTTHTLPNATTPRNQTSRYETVRRVLRNIANDFPAGSATELQRVLRDFDRSDTSTHLPVAQAFAKLNTHNNVPTDPQLSIEQIEAIKLLLTSPELEALSPTESSGEFAAQARVFWRELLANNPGEVHNFHHHITSYAADRTNRQAFEQILLTLYRFAPDGTWDKRHVDALVTMNTTEMRFKHLKWFSYPGDFW